MPIRVIVNGAKGKMGQLAVNTLQNHPDFEVVGELGRQNNLASTIQHAQAKIVVDLTNAESVFQNAETIINAGACPVIGTSGLVKEQVEQLQKQSVQLKQGGIIAPNFSIGAVLMMKYAQEIIKYFPAVEIIEAHHPGKLDSPSGTAVRTAELLERARTTSHKLPVYRETIPGARGAEYQGIPIHAVRLPGVIANQEIIFGGTGETLRLEHVAIDRQCFMPGIILCCQKVLGLNELVYGMENIL